MAEGTEGDLGFGPQTVGRALRERREALGRTLEDVAASTRIRPSYLAALETGDYAAFPDEFWARLFLLTYARHLGLAADETIAHAFGQGTPSASRPERARPDVEEPAEVAAREAVTYQPRSGRRRPRRTEASARERDASRSPERVSPLGPRAVRRQWTSPYLAVFAAVVVAALLAGIVYNFVHRGVPTTAASGRGGARTAGETATPGAGYTTVSLDPSAAQATYRVSDAPIRLNLTFRGRCWIGIEDVAGGADAVNHIYAAGQTLSFTSAQAVVVDVGSTPNARGTLNGQAFGPWAVGKPWLLTIEP
jgi:cytoskeletal protein RodZ